MDCGSEDLLPLLASLRTRQDVLEIKSIVLAGADVNVATPDEVGMTPLIMAIMSQNVEIVKCLICAGADINATHNGGRTPLMSALWTNVEMTRELLEAGCDVNVKDEDGETALIMAIQSEVQDNICQVIDHGASVNVVNSSGDPALIMAIRQNLPLNIIRKILAAGADVNVSDRNHDTPLMVAIKCRRSSLCQLLLASGATINQELHSVISSFLNEVIPSMINAGASPQPVCLSFSKMGFALKLRNIPSVFCTSAITPFMAALLSDNLNVVKVFLSLNYLDVKDLYLHEPMKSALCRYLEARNSSLRTLAMTDEIYGQPCPLWKLSFVHVSTIIGFQADRRSKISQTGLPNILKKKLMFEDATASLPAVKFSKEWQDFLRMFA